jgi:hypothetical protein
MKHIMLFIMIIAVPMTSFSQISLTYGEKAGQVGYYNQKNQKHYQDPYPVGPLAFRIQPDSIWVADSIGAKIDRNGNLQNEFSVIATPSTERLIEDFALEKDETGKVTSLWIIDGLYCELLNFDPQGKELGKIAHEKLIQPFSVEVSQSGRIYVADKAARAILVFDLNGKLLCEANWEWSGLAISEKADIFYRLFYQEEGGITYLVAQDLNEEVLAEIEVKLPPHKNPILWKVDEEKQEFLVTCTPIEGFKGKFMLIRAGFDGEIKAQSEIIPPYVMNRFIDMNGFNDTWLGVANYEEAPSGKFKIEPFKLP